MTTIVKFADMVTNIPFNAPFFPSMEIPMALGDRYIRLINAANSALIAHASNIALEVNIAMNNVVKVINDDFTPSHDQLQSEQACKIARCAYLAVRDELVDADIIEYSDIFITVGIMRHLMAIHRISFNPGNQWARFYESYGQLIIQA